MRSFDTAIVPSKGVVLAPKPPKGRGPALAQRSVPGAVLAVTVTVWVVAFVALVLLNMSGVMDALGPVKYGLIGLVAAGLVLVPRYFGYSAGRDWVRRGDSWAVTTELTSAQVDGQRLRMRDAGGRKVTIPLQVLANSDGLLTTLAEPVRACHARGDIVLDDEARALFAVPTDTAS